MIGLERYAPKDSDTWSWHLATLAQVADMVALSEQQFQHEIANTFTPSPEALARNVSIATIKQWHNKNEEQIIVAANKQDGHVMAWAWLARGCYLPYATEELAEAKIAHIDQAVNTVSRTRIMAQILHQWQIWCELNHIPVLVSSTIRSDQAGFLRLHEQAGFTIRGSYAFKRI